MQDAVATPQYRLKMSCPDRPGIVSEVATFFFQQDCNIIESAQYEDAVSGRFFMRTVLAAGSRSPTLDAMRQAFAAVGQRFEMDWELRAAARPVRTLIMASKADHCLVDLLYRHATGQLPIDIVSVVSNHPREQHQRADLGDIPFHYLPVTAETQAAQEQALLRLVDETAAELVVLARYMRVLGAEVCAALPGRIINIHHSFLPGFKGARPYDQAFAWGVKLIGATAHYVTPELDEGPIIEQAVERIDHRHSAAAMAAVGRDIEKLVLARAVEFHARDRVLLNGRRTVVFR